MSTKTRRKRKKPSASSSEDEGEHDAVEEVPAKKAPPPPKPRAKRRKRSSASVDVSKLQLPESGDSGGGTGGGDSMSSSASASASSLAQTESFTQFVSQQTAKFAEVDDFSLCVEDPSPARPQQKQAQPPRRKQNGLPQAPLLVDPLPPHSRPAVVAGASSGSPTRISDQFARATIHSPSSAAGRNRGGGGGGGRRTSKSVARRGNAEAEETFDEDMGDEVTKELSEELAYITPKQRPPIKFPVVAVAADSRRLSVLSTDGSAEPLPSPIRPLRLSLVPPEDGFGVEEEANAESEERPVRSSEEAEDGSGGEEDEGSARSGCSDVTMEAYRRYKRAVKKGFSPMSLVEFAARQPKD